jgi:hypothetical protein
MYKMNQFKNTPMALFYFSSLTLIIARIFEYILQYMYYFPQKEIVIALELANTSYVCAAVCL